MCKCHYGRRSAWDFPTGIHQPMEGIRALPHLSGVHNTPLIRKSGIEHGKNEQQIEEVFHITL